MEKCECGGEFEAIETVLGKGLVCSDCGEPPYSKEGDEEF